MIGLNLCPWAGGALVGGHMRVLVHPPAPPPGDIGSAGAGGEACSSSSPPDGKMTETRRAGKKGGGGGGGGGDEGGGESLDSLARAAAREATALGELGGEAAANATTLLVARPPVAEDFGEFLDVVGAVEKFLDDAGLRGTVQARGEDK